MRKKLLTIPTGLLLTGAIWPVVTQAEEMEVVTDTEQVAEAWAAGSDSSADVQLDQALAASDNDGLELERLADNDQDDEQDDSEDAAEDGTNESDEDSEEESESEDPDDKAVF